MCVFDTKKEVDKKKMHSIRKSTKTWRSHWILFVQIFSLIIRVNTQEPRFVEQIPNVTVALGRDASLPCIVDHLGNYKVAWIHIDRQMILTIHRHVITRLPRFSISHDNAMTWLLHVSQVQQEDRGYYMCQVNTNPMISQVGYLQVVVPPNIIDTESSQSALAVREHQNITLNCNANGFPKPKIMWRREDGKTIMVDKKKKVTVYEGENLSIPRVSRTEMGAYLCIATNGVPPSVSKRIIVDVEFLPMIWVPNQLVGAPAGTNVTLECHTEAYPRAISYWVFNSVMVLPSKKYSVTIDENSYRSHMKLTVRNLQSGDFGNYRCISKNSLGETEGSIRLYDIPMPSTSPKANEMKSSANSDDKSRGNQTKVVANNAKKPKVSGSDNVNPNQLLVNPTANLKDTNRRLGDEKFTNVLDEDDDYLNSGGNSIVVTWMANIFYVPFCIHHLLWRIH